jgi:hypothetical protein
MIELLSVAVPVFGANGFRHFSGEGADEISDCVIVSEPNALGDPAAIASVEQIERAELDV